MSWKAKVRTLIKIAKRAHKPMLPRGRNLFRDLSNSLPDYEVKVVFDVGANVGQSAIAFLRQFSGSRIYCFEPVGPTFRRLEQTLRGEKNAECFNVALGATSGDGTMALQAESEKAFLYASPPSDAVNGGGAVQAVKVVTLDEFCDIHEIARIHYLKIDTEGGDVEVLKGASEMLAEQRIDLVEVEAGMNPGNERHQPFEALKQLLESQAYFLFGIYEQIPESLVKGPLLRRTNPVFLSDRMIQKSRRSRGAGT